MSGTGSSEPTFIIELPALRGLRDCGLLDAGPHSALSWFVDQPVAEDAVEAALAAMREDDLLLADPERLDPGLHASLEILAQPLLRLRVVRVTDQPRSLVTYSDGVGAVSLMTDGQEVVITPVQSHESIARRITDGIAKNLRTRGPRLDLVGAEAALLGLVIPLAREKLDAPVLCAAVAELGGQVNEEDARDALAELTATGWLEEQAGSFLVAAAKADQIEPLTAVAAIDLRVTVFTADGELHRTHRFQQARDRVWRISPFLAGHDGAAPQGASEDAEIATLLGLSFVPQSRDMVEAFVFELLGAERKAKKRKPALGVKLR